MKPFAALVLIVGGASAFAIPGVPDVPGLEIPDIRIPGMELLDELQEKLDGLIAETDVLCGLIPDLAVLDDLSAKLTELRDTDPEMAELQVELDALRERLVSARAVIQAYSDRVQAELGSLKTVVDDFSEGLP